MSHVVVWYTLVVLTVSATAEILYTEGAALSNHSCRPADCVDLQCFNVVFENCGPLRVYPDDGAYVRVSCEVDPGGGWTVMQVIIRYIRFTPPLYSDLLSLPSPMVYFLQSWLHKFSSSEYYYVLAVCVVASLSAHRLRHTTQSL